jgi:hypothetical protein
LFWLFVLEWSLAADRVILRYIMLFICKGREMVRAKLKTPEGRKFLLALLVVFMIAAACGQPLLALSNSTTFPSAWNQHVCSAIGDDLRLQPGFTVLLAIPLGFFPV